MRLNNLIVEVNAGVGAKLEVGGAITAGGTVTAPTFRGSINVQSGRDLISNIPINQSIVLDIFV